MPSRRKRMAAQIKAPRIKKPKVKGSFPIQRIVAAVRKIYP